MITFQKIRWKNFLSTGDQFSEIDFQQNATNLIVGTNGTGKSTVLDALTFSLFNKPFRKINKSQLVNATNEKDTQVEVEFDINGRQYLVRRCMKPNLFEIEVDGQKMHKQADDRAMQKILEENILKVNYKSFTQIVILGSSAFVPFMQLSGSNRREVIEDLLDIRIFSAMNLIIKEKIRKQKDEIRVLDLSRENVKDKLDMQKKFIEELEKILQHHKLVKQEIPLKKKYCDGLAKRSALNKYDVERCNVFEEEGILERLGLWHKIDELSQRKIFINNGSYLILEQTSSFFAIDVNSGKNLKIGASEINSLACSEICRLIKVLGLGGKIIIDFLPCAKSEKRVIYDLIVASFLGDIPTNKIWGWTNGGSFELQRERDKSPLNLLVQHN